MVRRFSHGQRREAIWWTLLATSVSSRHGSFKRSCGTLGPASCTWLRRVIWFPWQLRRGSCTSLPASSPKPCGHSSSQNVPVFWARSTRLRQNKCKRETRSLTGWNRITYRAELLRDIETMKIACGIVSGAWENNKSSSVSLRALEWKSGRLFSKAWCRTGERSQVVAKV